MLITNQKQAVKVSTLAGLGVAAGGALKDAPHEGFKPQTFIRSPAIAGSVGYLLYKKYKNVETPIWFFSTIGIERLIVEGWKLLRAHRPVKFKIGEWGKPIGGLRCEKCLNLEN